MSLPKPPIHLTGHCSAIHNNTLYVYSPAGFQSLPLRRNATWSTLEPGVSVTGGACVKAETADSDQAALYIVGGATNSSAPSYSGLQRYLFSNKTWETITPVVTVTQNRQNHGAAFINSTQQILVYAGSQTSGNDGPSSQTFLISTSPPYNVLSFNSAAPPLKSPMIMPWNDSQAVMVGGASDNIAIYTFSPEQGWRYLGTNLTEPISNPDSTKCSLISGDDGSKVLELYNMGTAPNEVARYLLLDASGQPAAPGETVGAPPSETPASRKRKRILTVANWPVYNSTFAPSVPRSEYSIAESSDGLAVITGGNSEEPLAIFNQRQNTWLNASTLLGNSRNQTPMNPDSTSLPSVSVVSPTATPSSSTPAASSGPSRHTLTVLGAVLGAIFGLAAILVLILVLLKWQREKKEGKKSYLNEKDDRLSFADQGAEFMHTAGGSLGQRYSKSLSTNDSVTSLGIFQGKSGKKMHTRGVPSDSSTLGLVKHAKSPLGLSEPLEMSHMENQPPTMAARSLAPGYETSLPHDTRNLSPAARSQDPNSSSNHGPSRSRSNGWSRYFANNEVTNLASMQPSDRNTLGSEASNYRTSDTSQSGYTDSRVFSSATGVKPLELNLGPKFDGQRLSRVATGSPTIGQSTEDVREGQTAEFSRYDSTGTNFTTTFNLSSFANNSDSVHGKPNDGGANTWSYSNPYFMGTRDRYHQPKDQTVNAWSSRSRAESTSTSSSSLYPGHKPFASSGTRDSSASNVTVFPHGQNQQSPTIKNFPGPKQDSKLTTPQTYEFPLPKAYFDGNQPRDSTASSSSIITVFPHGLDSPTRGTFGNSIPTAKPKLVDVPRNPPPVPIAPASMSTNSSPQRKGPAIRRLTGDEDMSWLNLNAH